MFPENWHFNSYFVLKTTKTPLFVLITEILWRTFWCNNWRSVFDVVKILRFSVLRIKRLSQFWINLSDSMNLNLKDLSCVSTFLIENKNNILIRKFNVGYKNKGCFNWKFFKHELTFELNPLTLLKLIQLWQSWKEKLSHGQILNEKNSHLPTILRVFLCRKNAKNSSDRREAELCSFQTLKRKNYRLVNNGLKLLDFNPCCLVIFTKISQGRL